MSKVAFLGNSFGESSGPLKRAGVISNYGHEVDVIMYYGCERFESGVIKGSDLYELYRKQISYAESLISGKVYNLNSAAVFSFSGVIALWRLLKKESYSAVFVHHDLMGVLGVLICFLCGQRNIIKVEMSDNRRKSLVVRFCSISLSLLCKKVIFISAATASSYGRVERAFVRGKSEVIYNGIDLKAINSIRSVKRCDVRHELGVSEDDVLMLSVGRLHAVKNYPLLINAFNLARKHNKRLKFIIAGEGAERPRLESLLEELNLSSEVKLLGNVALDQVFDLMAVSDIYVMGSFSEGFSEAMLQALAFGMPVSATLNSSFREALNEGECGILSEFDHKIFSEKILSLANSPALRNAYGEKAKKRASEFSIHDVAKKYINLF